MEGRMSLVRASTSPATTLMRGTIGRTDRCLERLGRCYLQARSVLRDRRTAWELLPTTWTLMAVGRPAACSGHGAGRTVEGGGEPRVGVFAHGACFFLPRSTSGQPPPRPNVS